MDRRYFLKRAGLATLVLGSTGFRCSGKHVLDRQTLLVAGSATLLPYVKALMVGFGKDLPQVDVVVEGGGSSAGLLAVSRGAIDLGLMSRDLNAHEDDELEVRTVLVAKDALAIVVHPSNPIVDIKSAVIKEIFLGRLTDWKDLPGGSPGPISVISRRLGSPGRRGFEDLALDGAEVFHKAVQYGPPVAVQRAVSANPGAIGFLSMHDLGPGAKSVRIDGVGPDRRSILSDRFKYARSLFLAVRGAPRGAAKDFIDYSTGEKGQQVLSDSGLYSVY